VKERQCPPLRASDWRSSRRVIDFMLEMGIGY